jgi:metal-responsive CopG/Arc/MetJ family transcriptional regulator
MARATATSTVSLPPDMLTEFERVCDEEHRTRSEPIREALQRYFRVKVEEEMRQR